MASVEGKKGQEVSKYTYHHQTKIMATPHIEASEATGITQEAGIV
jgi:hypothetical protein